MLGRLRFAGLALVVFSPSAANADIDPPAGLRWIRPGIVLVANADAFPDYVLIDAPCYDTETSLPHCVIPREKNTRLRGALYAGRTQDLPTKLDERSGDSGLSLRVIDLPDASGEKFFQSDKRLLRSSLNAAELTTSTTAVNSGVRGTTLYVEIDRIGPPGVEAHVARAKYECVGGAEVTLEWDPKATHAPMPRCPVTDDRGDLVPASEGPPPPGASSTLPPAPRRRSPFSAERMIWLGSAALGVSLLAAGWVLRKKPSA